MCHHREVFLAAFYYDTYDKLLINGKLKKKFNTKLRVKRLVKQVLIDLHFNELTYTLFHVILT